jgi:hypothetical protein
MAEPSIAAQVVALTHLSVAELRVRWQEVFGETTTQRHKGYLTKRLAWELQRRYFGDELSSEARARLHELQEEFRTTPPTSWFKGAKHNRGAAPSPTTRKRPVRDSRSPKPGTTLTRTYRGERIVVTVVEGGFMYGTEVYRSLSAVARAVTGSHCSGIAFFGLSSRKDGEQ